ncbi:Uncharacterised protein [Bordetella pertussis]|nr:Uncharacterised protein [Bordetella pertussis]
MIHKDAIFKSRNAIKRNNRHWRRPVRGRAVLISSWSLVVNCQ